MNLSERSSLYWWQSNQTVWIRTRTSIENAVQDNIGEICLERRKNTLEPFLLKISRWSSTWRPVVANVGSHANYWMCTSRIRTPTVRWVRRVCESPIDEASFKSKHYSISAVMRIHGKLLYFEQVHILLMKRRTLFEVFLTVITLPISWWFLRVIFTSLGPKIYVSGADISRLVFLACQDYLKLPPICPSSFVRASWMTKRSYSSLFLQFLFRTLHLLPRF